MKRVALVVIMLFGAMLCYSPGYGEQYDDSEQLAIGNTFQYALEYNKHNQASAWVNPDTGRSGSTVPVKTFVNDRGEYCREYIQTIFIGGEPQQGYGTACRQPDGTWLVASGGQVVEYRAVEHYVYPYGYPYWYNRYPYYTWDYYPRIFFSFDILHFSGHHHYFRHHHHIHKHHFHGGQQFYGPRHLHGTRNFHGTRHFYVKPDAGTTIRHQGGGHHLDADRHLREGERRVGPRHIGPRVYEGRKSYSDKKVNQGRH